jgi:hypothetical protein
VRSEQQHPTAALALGVLAAGEQVVLQGMLTAQQQLVQQPQLHGMPYVRRRQLQ